MKKLHAITISRLCGNTLKKNSECAECNRNKVLKHVFYGQFKLFKILIKSWKLIALDFVIKLLLFKIFIIKIEYDNILMNICKFTKYKYFISYLKIFIAIMNYQKRLFGIKINSLF